MAVYLTTSTCYKGPGVWMRPPETISRPSGPSETMWRPLEVGGSGGYMYTLYITYARADDLSQTKRGSSEGVLYTKMGPERSK